MSLISFPFLFFFTSVAILYFLLETLQRRYSQNSTLVTQTFIFIASLTFYALAGLSFLPYIIFITVVTYFGGLVSARENCPRPLFFVFIILDVAPLLFFKYAPQISMKFFSKQLSLLFPLGLSFYTFQSLSYIADVYRKKIPVEKNFLTVAAFVNFFPCLSSGPIQRAGNLIPQLKAPRSFDYDNATDGMKLFAWGMFKKLLIADQLALYVNFVYSQLDSIHGFAALIAAIMYPLQVYCDFSGYSDMAIGTARFLGFDAGKNFDHPFLATSLGELWRRWHISLSSWLRDYIYIPLGGSKVSLPRIYTNLMITFIVSGIWHGSTLNYLFWGCGVGLFVCIERATKNVRSQAKSALRISADNRLWNAVCVIFTFILFAALCVIFRAESLKSSVIFFKKISQVPVELVQTLRVPTIGHIKSSVAAFTDISRLQIDSSRTGDLLTLIEMFAWLFIFLGISISTFKKSGLEIVRSFSSAKRWILYTILLIVLVMNLLLNSTQSSEFIYNQF